MIGKNRLRRLYTRLFTFEGIHADSDMIRVLVGRNLRLLLRGRYFRNALIVSILVPALVLCLGFLYCSIVRKQMTGSQYLVLTYLTHLVAVLAMVTSWSLGMVNREIQSRRIEDLLLIGCHPREMVGSVCLEALILVSLLSLMGLPLINLILIFSGLSFTRGFILIIVEIVCGYLMIALGMTSQGSYKTTKGAPAAGAAIANAVALIIWMNLALFQFSTPQMPPPLRMMSGISPLIAVQSAFTRGDTRWITFVVIVIPVSYFLVRLFVSQASFSQEHAEEMLAKPIVDPYSEKMFSLNIIRTATAPWEKPPVLTFESGNPIFQIEALLGRRIRVMPVTWFFICLALIPAIFTELIVGINRQLVAGIALFGLLLIVLPIPCLSGALSFQADTENGQFEYYLLTRLKRLEIFWGKLLPTLFSLKLPLGIIAGYLLIISAMRVLTSTQLILILAGLIIYPLSLSGISALIGTRCHSIREAAMSGFFILGLPLAVALFAPLFGCKFCIILSPFTAIYSLNPSIIAQSLLLYFTLILLTQLTATNHLDHLALRL